MSTPKARAKQPKDRTGLLPPSEPVQMVLVPGGGPQHGLPVFNLVPVGSPEAKAAPKRAKLPSAPKSATRSYGGNTVQITGSMSAQVESRPSITADAIPAGKSGEAE